ncbi:MAG: glycosyltransferase family 4 protein [Candidatus Microgenomates bacterium]
MKKKHIIFTTYDSIGNPYYNGGGAHAIHEIAKRLAKYYKITVIAGSYPGAKNLQRDGVAYHYHSYLFSPRLSQLLYIITLPFFVRKLKPDLIIESFTPPFSISHLPLMVKEPVIGLVHMLSARDMERKYLLPFTWIENIGLNWYHHFIVLSTYWQEVIRSVNNAANFYVIPNAVDIANYQPKSKEKYMLFLGRIEINQKGLDLLLAAWDQLKNPLKLIIAGKGSDEEIASLKESINKLKNKSSVHYIGHVVGSLKSKLLSSALATVIPSRYETFSMTALESLAHSTPIICFDIPGMDWISPSSVLRAKSFDTKSLASLIRRLSASPALLTKLSKSALEESKKYNFNKIIEQYRQVIKDLT